MLGGNFPQGHMPYRPLDAAFHGALAPAPALLARQSTEGGWDARWTLVGDY